MDRAEHLRQGIWDGLSILLLAAVSIWSAVTRFESIFLFCAVAGAYLIFRFSYRVIADSRIVSGMFLLLMTVSALILVVLSGQIPAFLFLPFSFPAMRGEEKRSAATLLFRILLLPVAFIASGVSGIFRFEMTDAVLLALVFGAFSSVVCFTERSLVFAEERRRQEHLLLEKSVSEAIAERERRQSLAHNNALVALKARQEERETLSRNIHNEVGHSITASLVALEAADVLLDRDKELARQKIRTACDRMRESLDGIRKAVRVMDETGFIHAGELARRIEAETRRFSDDTEIIVRFHAELMDENARVPSEHAEFLSGAVRELLSNGVRHGKATSFVLALKEDAAGLRLTSEDNGRGASFAAAGAAVGSTTGDDTGCGFGLAKIGAYAEKFGGNLRIAPGEGFRVTIDLPVIRETVVEIGSTI